MLKTFLGNLTIPLRGELSGGANVSKIALCEAEVFGEVIFANSLDDLGG